MAWKTNLCSLFEMEVEIKQGVNLIARDRSGTSLQVRCTASGTLRLLGRFDCQCAVCRQAFKCKGRVESLDKSWLHGSEPEEAFETKVELGNNYFKIRKVLVIITTSAGF